MKYLREIGRNAAISGCRSVKGISAGEMVGAARIELATFTPIG